MFTITSGTACSKPGGSLLVGGRCDNGSYTNFNVSFDRNVEIQNYKTNAGTYDYSTSASIKNGKTTIQQDRNRSDMHMSEESYLIFNKIRKLDKNNDSFSEKDIEAAKRAGMNVTGSSNKGDGIVTIKTKDGWIIKLDFETDEEKARANAKTTKKETPKAATPKEPTIFEKIATRIDNFMEKHNLHW